MPAAAATPAPAGVATAPDGAMADVQAISSVWPAVVDHLQADGESLLAASAREGRPVELAGDTLRIGFPSTATFSMRKVTAPACREQLAAAVRAVTGARVRIDAVVHAGPDADEAEPTLSEDEFIARVVAEFDAEELPPEPQPESKET
jgi:DNA polymerase-3 subunit gamma/tau